jgi:putative endopeptidase
MDENRVEELGAKAIEPELHDLKNAKTRDDFAALIGRATTDLEFSLFNPVIDVDLKDPAKYAFYLTQGGIGLPDRDYYLKPDFAAAKDRVSKVHRDNLAIVELADPDKNAKEIVEFETKIADGQLDQSRSSATLARFTIPMSVQELAKIRAGFAVGKISGGGEDAEPDSCHCRRRKALFRKLSRHTRKRRSKPFAHGRHFISADNAAPVSFEGRSPTHTSNCTRKRWPVKRNNRRVGSAQVTAVSGGDFLIGDRFGTFGTMGFGVGQLYTAKYFPPEAKEKIQSLVANLKNVYRARIEKLDWMGPETKKEALKKLDTYTIKVGYPDHPRDYSKLAIRADDLVGNVKRCAQLDWDFYTGRFWGPVDRTDWGMTPQTNDAYNGGLRDIVFPAGILQPPVFDPETDPAVNYGGAGGVIGHELTHGFDDQGRKIDASGALRDWWTEKDAETFKARASMLGAQYSKYEPIPGVQVNGELTMGENIADLGGLTLALDAYRASLRGQPAPVLDGYNGEQRVFLGWAQAWRGKVTDDYVKKQVVTDPHSPRQFRVIGRLETLMRGMKCSKCNRKTRCSLRPTSVSASGEEWLMVERTPSQLVYVLPIDTASVVSSSWALV